MTCHGGSGQTSRHYRRLPLHRRHGQDGYQPGYDFEELWRLDLQSNKWALLPAGGEPSLGTHPGPRYLHQTVVVDDSMFLFGGLTESEDAGVWEYNLSTGNWAAHNSSGNGPGPLASFAMAPVALEGGIRGFIVFGGRSLPEPDRNKQLNANIWFYDVRARAWRHIPPRQGSPVPKPRAYPGFALATPNAGLNTVGFLMGGTTTSGSMTCASDAWMFELDCHGSRVGREAISFRFVWPVMCRSMQTLEWVIAGASSFVAVAGCHDARCG